MNAGASVGPIADYRRYWLPELIVLVALAGATAIVFGVTDLDVAAARWFYRPGVADGWPVAARWPWSLLYRSAPALTGILAVGGAALLVAGLIRAGAGRLRLHGLFILFCVAIGPGVIINGMLKDHWGRPRPRQIVEFGGQLAYTPPLRPAAAHGKSFPCGHCSVGFLYAAGWWLWRRSRPRLAAASLAAGVAVGSLLGLGRMAAGAHFLSDDLWSGLIAFGVAHALYYYALRLPAREDARAAIYPLIERSRRARAAAIAAAVLLAAGIAGGGILASPQYCDLTARVRLDDLPARPAVVELAAGTLDVELVLVDAPADEVTCRGDLHGFGLPTDDIRAAWQFAATPVPALLFTVTEKGWFTDLDGLATIRVPCAGVRRISVRLRHGGITVRDLRTAAGGVLPELDLHTGDGVMRRFPPARSRRPALDGGGGGE